ncbi:response regulator [Bradyrhizobium icense]|uniref:Response regulatory domain-containing protein n=1 Tax=Bradyrhizobium icense TaxID=1274631 RepID=A0A1B1UEJ3_9BRAD|nr:response regulator [Bradyrhizobium icense]ANW01197.1 hypothetical protein LMTR13_14480 [Bradyrhizobium icense]
MTGLELQSELLKRDIRIPTIVMTASDNQIIATRAKSLRAAALIRKPVRKDALLAAVHSAFKRHSQRSSDY